MPFFQKKWYSIVNAGFYSYIVENIINPLIFYAMKNILVKIGVLCSLIFCISFLNGCQKEELTLSNNDDVATGVTTRVLSGFHWKCPRCGFLNGGWRSTCTNLDCNGEYEASHSDMLLGFVKAMTNVIKLVGAEGGPIDPNRIEIKKNLFPAIAPEPWYEEAIAVRYYETARSVSMDSANKLFLEVYDFAWYRTVRVLYPYRHTVAAVNREFSIYNTRIGPTLKQTAKGRGILEGTRAAVQAFDALY